MLNRLEVIVLTNKQVHVAENIHLAPLGYASGKTQQLWNKTSHANTNEKNEKRQ